MKARISRLVMDVGVPANVKGYEYIREAIMLCYRDRNYLEAITKKLNPDIAKSFNTTASRVERAIRHGIELAYERRNYTLKKIFCNNLEKKPSNSLFLSLLVEYLLLEDAETDSSSGDSEPFHVHYDCLPDEDISEDTMIVKRSTNSFESEIRALKDHIIDLRVSAIDASIPKGHCPHAYFCLDEDVNYCGDGDCFTCRNQFLSKMRDKIKKEVYSPDYLNQ